MTVEHLKNRDPGAGDLDRRITDLESRISGVEQQISRIGKMLGHPVMQHLSEEFLKDQGPVRTFGGAAKEENDAIESRIGEYGMAWLGNIVLL
ncbi:MAG: hypothetical protein EHM46_05590, partial [Bacteroidetes bacterium]